MTTELSWAPSRHLQGEFEAEAGGVCYRVSSFGSTFTSPGAWYASADRRHLGRFPYTPTGRQAAFAACEADAREQAAVALAGAGQARKEAPDEPRLVLVHCA
jgi:hypothetical protein